MDSPSKVEKEQPRDLEFEDLLERIKKGTLFFASGELRLLPSLPSLPSPSEGLSRLDLTTLLRFLSVSVLEEEEEEMEREDQSSSLRKRTSSAMSEPSQNPNTPKRPTSPIREKTEQVSRTEDFSFYVSISSSIDKRYNCFPTNLTTPKLPHEQQTLDISFLPRLLPLLQPSDLPFPSRSRTSLPSMTSTTSPWTRSVRDLRSRTLC
ncbi:hypothetical protein BDY24DRAFT_395315 [Mrakia frigida]|uniref:uncharacterized protein n=1 Tax=Mrakia frigida TaxID=29902 RepID=UPI003FCC041C